MSKVVHGLDFTLLTTQILEIVNTRGQYHGDIGSEIEVMIKKWVADNISTILVSAINEQSFIDKLANAVLRMPINTAIGASCKIIPSIVVQDNR